MKPLRILIILLIAVNGALAQAGTDTIYFSDSLNQVLLYHSHGLNAANPELWVTYGLGLNQNSDTIAIARDSAFHVTFNGFTPKVPCRHFADEEGTSAYCILKATPKLDFLKNHGYSSDGIVMEKSTSPTIAVVDQQLVQVEDECEHKHDILKGFFTSQIFWDGAWLQLSKASFSYHVDLPEDSIMLHEEEILRNIQRVHPAVILRTENLEFIVSSYDLTSHRGSSYSRLESGLCQRFYTRLEGFEKTWLLRRKL